MVLIESERYCNKGCGVGVFLFFTWFFASLSIFLVPSFFGSNIPSLVFNCFAILGNIWHIFSLSWSSIIPLGCLYFFGAVECILKCKSTSSKFCYSDCILDHSFITHSPCFCWCRKDNFGCLCVFFRSCTCSCCS